MRRRAGVWCGVDVGAHRKGFHLAAIDAAGLIHAPKAGFQLEEAAAWLSGLRPALTAVDSPISCAQRGASSRVEERRVPLEVGCNIRFTPDLATILARTDGYYDWMTHGLALYETLRAAGLEIIECFPTASWTRWAGRRGTQSRAAWTRHALVASRLERLPERTNQDQRDAVAAALTARAHDSGWTEAHGEIVVPRAGSTPWNSPTSEAVG
jgi:predicted nuclease with RNAse H fold